MEEGWQGSEDRSKELEFIKQHFQEGEVPILATKMKRGSNWGEGFSVISNKIFWWLHHKSDLMDLLDSAVGAVYPEIPVSIFLPFNFSARTFYGPYPRNF